MKQWQVKVFCRSAWRARPIRLQQRDELPFILSASSVEEQEMKRWCGVLFLFIAVSTSAQSTNATLSGTVLDPAGARIPNVQVTAENTQTGIALTNHTNEAGVYMFPSLQPGTYHI